MTARVENDRVLFVKSGDRAEANALDGREYVVVDMGRRTYVVIMIVPWLVLEGTWADVVRESRRKPLPPVDENAEIDEPRVTIRWRKPALLVPESYVPSASVTASVAYDRAEPETAGGPSAATERGFEESVPFDGSAGGLESIEPQAGAAAEATTITTAFNVDFERHDDTRALEVDTPYVLAIYTGDRDPGATISVDGQLTFRAGENDVALTVHLTSADFRIEQASQSLVVKRDGKSRGRARFDVTPLHAGRCVIDAIVLADGNFVQKIAIVANAGNAAPALDNVKTSGRPFSPDETIRERDLVLVVEQTSGGDLQIIAARRDADAIAGRSSTTTAAELDDLIRDLRARIKTVIDETEDGADFAYQVAVKISPEVHQKTLATIAEAANFVFKTIFFGAGADAGMKAIGRVLLGLADGPPRSIQIVTTRFSIPWQLLYAARVATPPDPKFFLGFSHRIDQTPLESGWPVRGDEIRHESNLRLGINVNRSIDEDVPNVVANQLEFFERLRGSNQIQIEVRDAATQVKSALLDPNNPDQIIYFYCHAESKTSGEGVSNSVLEFGKEDKLTLRELRAAWDPDARYAGAPLVFINACQSAELSPLFYDGFVAELTSHGARGVIGTECDTPAVFAAAWAQQFFSEFLSGKELGETVLALRRKYLHDDNNVMGLLYAVHCNGNTRVDPAIGLTES